jgi:serine/threonine protein kinase/tetratricopeptide (TPR) repeat protein
MVCPHCGTDSDVEDGTCSACGRPASAAGDRAARESLIPIPPDSEAETRLSTGRWTAVPRSGYPTLTPGAPFGERYRIERLLGAGGMGVVYKAWDEELGLSVALKVIRPEVMADPIIGAELERRFKRELVLARQVTHRHVVRIHDMGHVNDVKYLTMSYVQGQTLAALLKTEGKLAVPRALAIMREVADGLAAAHAVGVVHRDLKPENVMLDGDGHAVIMDFGISRSTSPGAGTAHDSEDRPRSALEAAILASSMTVAGAVMGTLEYMPPEQARGEPVDQRADIYAFGLIFRDVVLGNVRMAGTTAIDELRGRMEHALPASRSVDSRIPPLVDDIIRRCIEPDAAERFRTSDELIAALNRLDAQGELKPEPRRFGRRHLAAALALVLALVTGTWWLARSRVPPPAPAPVSVLIQDFDVGGVEGLQGTVEQSLTISMEGAPFVTVFPRRDARALAARLVPASQGRVSVEIGRLIAQREGIKLMLGGSVSVGTRGFDVRVRALDATTGSVVTEVRRRVRDKEQILGAIAMLAEDVRAELGDTTPEDVRQAQRETFTAASLDAAREYSLAQDLAASSKDEEALAHYRRAIDLDPNFGRAYSGAAYSASQLGRKEEAGQLWKKALSVVDRMTEREKYRTLGLFYGTVSRDYDQAIANYKELVRRYPADGAGHNNLALAYFSTRDFAGALEEGRRVLEIYPRKLLYRGNYALYAMYASDFTAARSEAEQIVQDEPTYYPAYFPLAVAALARPDVSVARDAYGRMAKTGPAGASLAALGLADVAMYEGDFEQAVQILRQSIQDDERTGDRGLISAKYVALGDAYRGMNSRPNALEAVRKALGFGQQEELVVPAARTLLWAGRLTDARAMAQTLQKQFEPHRRAYGKLVEGEIAQQAQNPIEALEAFRAAQKLSDTWLGRFDLGVLYVESGRYAEALSELDLCQRRQGEAAALFLDDVPSFRYVAPLPYWLARAQEGLGMKEPATANFKAYLAARKNAPRDPLAADARRRIPTP